MSTWKTFLEEQERIYSEIEKKSLIAKRKGLREDGNIEKKFGGLFVVLFHPLEVSTKIERFSKTVASLVPATIYSRTEVHTTIASCHYGSKFNFQFSKYREDLEIFSDVVSSIIDERSLKIPAINYPGYLYTQNVVIAKGIPKRSFVELAERINTECIKRGMETNMPWGAHSTTNRFYEDRKPENTKNLFEFIETSDGPGESMPIEISVGWSDWEKSSQNPNPCGHFRAYKTFSLAK